MINNNQQFSPYLRVIIRPFTTFVGVIGIFMADDSRKPWTQYAMNADWSPIAFRPRDREKDREGKMGEMCAGDWILCSCSCVCWLANNCQTHPGQIQFLSIRSVLFFFIIIAAKSFGPFRILYRKRLFILSYPDRADGNSNTAVASSNRSSANKRMNWLQCTRTTNINKFFFCDRDREKSVIR